MYFSDGSYYHVVKNKCTRLDRDLFVALRVYHERELGGLPPEDFNFSQVCYQYLALGTKDLSPRTVKTTQSTLRD